MINKVILVGNVGAEPEVRYVKENQAVANIRLATTERGYRLADGTEIPDRTEWHRITAWGSTAKFVESWVHTGDQIYIEGRLHYSQYQDKNNETRYSTEIVVNELRKLGRRPADQTTENAPKNNDSKAAANLVAEQQSDYPQPAKDESDDLPF